ncbi:MAG: hypothetical protein KDD94_08390, partial [Calditrichaeota bacterium]|nr:hypothetical protein [Calditrichota bacterium]
MKTIRLNRTSGFASLFMICLITLIIISLKILPKSNSDWFVYAVLFDLLISLPVIYLSLIKPYKISRLSVIPVFILMITISYKLLPVNHHSIIQQIQFIAIPGLELLIIILITRSVLRTIRLYKKNKQEIPDFPTLCRKTISTLFTNQTLLNIISSELSVFYYAFNFKKTAINDNQLSYHRRNGLIAMIVAVIFLMLIEGFALHLLLINYSTLITWLLSFSTFYAILFAMAHLNACRLRPVAITGDRLFIYHGLTIELIIPVTAILSIHKDKTAVLSKKIAKAYTIG